MKTAMQQYIDWINSNDFRAAEDRGDMHLIERMELQFIELEKQQIEVAFFNGQSSGYFAEPDIYYNRTFKID